MLPFVGWWVGGRGGGVGGGGVGSTTPPPRPNPPPGGHGDNHAFNRAWAWGGAVGGRGHSAAPLRPARPAQAPCGFKP